jgi:diguanylate cyclase (GGDEF)-like protein/PAS domain S-box-containing protein
MAADGTRGGQSGEPGIDAAALLAMLRHSTDLVGVVEPEGVLRPGPFGFLGYSAEWLAAQESADLVHPDDLDHAAASFLSALEQAGPTPPFRCRLRHADGSWRTYEIVGTNMLDHPSVRGILFNGRDVTESDAAEAAVQAAERRWRRMLQSSTESVTVVGADGHIVFETGNGSMLGYEEEWRTEDVSDALASLVHPDDVEMAARRWAELLATPGFHPPLLFRLRHADGTWRWAESFASNLIDDPDVRGMIVTTRDVTERELAIAALRDETHVLDTLHTIGRRLAGELDLDLLLQAITDAATDVTGAAFGAFFYNMVSAAGESYLLYTLSGVPREAFENFPMPRATAVFAPTFDGVGPVRCDDVTADPRYGLSAPYNGMPPGHLKVRSYLAVPVVSRGGEVHGGLFFGHPEVGVFTERGERLAVGIAAQAAIAIDNARLYQGAQNELEARRQAEAELAHQATHDPLTGLPNRTLLRDRLGQAVAHLERGGRSVAVLLLDLDRFKVVNDSLGHAAGDEILVSVAERLLAAVRPGDTVARLGGDEFVVVCDELHGELDAVGLADRVAAAFAPPFEVEGHVMNLSASIGIAMAKGTVSSPDTLLRDADSVMYRAKERGGGRWEIFDATLRERVVERLRVETDLRRALDGRELRLYFQPVVSLAAGTTSGAEALMRWEHPGQGLVLPDDFIHVAEESGLIVLVGQLALLEGCAQLARFGKDEATASHTVSVNVSARQMVQSDLVAGVRGAIAATGADPTRLVLEITESALMEDVDAVGAVLQRLRRIGVQVWVDDFGTGYSSLSHLRRLPIDGLKIDRTFVAGLAASNEDRTIVASIVNLAHNLGLSALAEGVETQWQADRLRELGCDLAQGFLWSAAVPPSD